MKIQNNIASINNVDSITAKYFIRGVRISLVQILYSISLNKLTQDNSYEDFHLVDISENIDSIIEFLHINHKFSEFQDYVNISQSILKDITSSMFNYINEIDDKISKLLKSGWDINMMSDLIIAILRCGIYENHYLSIVQIMKTKYNENHIVQRYMEDLLSFSSKEIVVDYMEIAKTFGYQNEVSFINHILDHCSKNEINKKRN